MLWTIMQVNSILNILLPTAAAGSTPFSLLGEVGSLLSEGAEGFAGLLAEGGETVSDGVEDLLGLNNPNGGIVPLPQVSDTVPPSLAKQLYVSQRDGRVPPEVIKGMFGKQEVPQDTSLSGLNELAPSAGTSDVVNNADAIGEVALQESGKIDISQMVSKYAPKVDNTDLNKKREGGLSLSEILAQRRDGNNLLDSAAPTNKGEGDTLDLSTLDKMPEAASATSATMIQGLNDKVKTEFSKLQSDAIDVNELQGAPKFKEYASSKIEHEIAKIQHHAPNPAEQVKIKIMQGLNDGQDKIKIKLHPAELGMVKVEMDVAEDGKTHVRIVADKSETLDLLRRDSYDLQRALKDAGMDIEDNMLQFSLNSDSKGSGDGFDDMVNSSPSNQGEEVEEIKFDEYSKYGGMSVQELVLDIKSQGLNIVA